LSEGATFTVNDRDFTISYTGGDGNDIVLTVDATYAFVTYVNDDWNGDGTTPDVGDPVSSPVDQVTTRFEAQTLPDSNGLTNSGWDTVSEAIANVSEGGAVMVLSGPTAGFVEDVTIDKRLTLQGAFKLDGSFTAAPGSKATILGGRSGGTLEITGDFALDSSTTLMMTVLPDGPATNSNLIVVNDGVDLGGATLKLNLVATGTGSYENIVLIDNAGSDAVLGTFAGLAEGARMATNTGTFWLTYSGGDGNDVELVVPDSATAVVGRQIFYNDSFFDGNDSAINASDDGAIATDKTAYLPGDGLATFANITGYAKGINGIMIDIQGLAAPGSITAADFSFAVGADNTPGTWAAAPVPSAVAVATGAGISGSDRITITWANDTIEDTWLEVQVLSTINTGLVAPDVFFFGNKVGDTTDPAVGTMFVTLAASDGGAIIANTGFLVGITNRFDINKDNHVTLAADRGVVLANTGFLSRINIDLGPTIESLVGPPTLISGVDTTLTASVPLLADGTPDPSVVRVDFYQDVNGNGVLDAGDQLAAAGVAYEDANNNVVAWTGTFDAADLDDTGAPQLIAVPVDIDGPMVPSVLPDPPPVKRFPGILVPPNFPIPVPQVDPIINLTMTEVPPAISTTSSIFAESLVNGTYTEHYNLNDPGTLVGLTSIAANAGSFVFDDGLTPPVITGAGFGGGMGITWVGGGSSAQVMAQASSNAKARYDPDPDAGSVDVYSSGSGFAVGNVTFTITSPNAPVGTPVTIAQTIIYVSHAVLIEDLQAGGVGVNGSATLFQNGGQTFTTGGLSTVANQNTNNNFTVINTTLLIAGVVGDTIGINYAVSSSSVMNPVSNIFTGQAVQGGGIGHFVYIATPLP